MISINSKNNDNISSIGEKKTVHRQGVLLQFDIKKKKKP